MYRSESVDVQGKPMPVLVFEPEGNGPHPGLVIAQHLPVAHTGLENDPFQINVGERYAAAGYVCVIPFVFHWWPTDADIDVKRAEFRDDWTVADLSAAFALLTHMVSVDENRIGILGHCWGGRIAWLGACHEPRFKACAVFYGGRVKAPFADGAPPPITLREILPARYWEYSATRTRGHPRRMLTITRRHWIPTASPASSIAMTVQATAFRTSTVRSAIGKRSRKMRGRKRSPFSAGSWAERRLLDP